MLINCFPSMGFDIHLIANFGALALITLAGPAVIFILFYRRGALEDWRVRDTPVFGRPAGRCKRR